jgi:hypothetical protein
LAQALVLAVLLVSCLWDPWKRHASFSTSVGLPATALLLLQCSQLLKQAGAWQGPTEEALQTSSGRKMFGKLNPGHGAFDNPTWAPAAQQVHFCTEVSWVPSSWLELGSLIASRLQGVLRGTVAVCAGNKSM